MMLIKILLWPFSLLYSLVAWVRNLLYNRKFFRSFRFDIKTIGVGNIRVGGTGKTPHVEYLINLLKSQYTISTLSRGYGRKTKGFILADESSDATTIGDEPMQFYSKYSPEVSVAVGADRVMAVPHILKEKPEVNLILLDDAYQHRAISSHINILLTEFSKPFYDDLVLPAGRLRESRGGAKRADAIIVTKCPDNLSLEQRQSTIKEIEKYSTPNVPVFFTGLKYKEPIPLNSESSVSIGKQIVLVSGIANSQNLENKIKHDYSLSRHFNFSDHYVYTHKSIESVIKYFQSVEGDNKSILLTEKDMVKWKNPEFKSMLSDISVFYLPVEIYFLADKHKFDEMILSKLEEKDANDD